MANKKTSINPNPTENTTQYDQAYLDKSYETDNQYYYAELMKEINDKEAYIIHNSMHLTNRKISPFNQDSYSDL